MSIDSLVLRITESPKFQTNYHNLLFESVKTQVANIQTENDTLKEIDWNYLISCASIMVQSNDGKILDKVYRICQTAVSSNINQDYKNAAAMLFNQLSNSAAIELSKSRNYIQDNYLEKIPIGVLLDIKQNQFANTVIEGNKPIILNQFQKEVYSAFDNNNTITISAPTSAGKSFILLHLLSNYIRQNPLAKIIYIVPTRALIQQVEIDIKEQFKQSTIDVEITSIPVLPDNYDENACIFVFTQERLQWILNENPDIIINLIIVDEAHKVSDHSRGILLQQVLQQISHNGSTKFIFASPMSENPEALFKIVKPQEKQTKILSEIVTVNQNLFWVSQSGRRTTKWNIDLVNHEDKIFVGSVTTKRITHSASRLPILAYRIAENRKGNLLYVNGAAEAEKVAVQLKSLVLEDHPTFSPSKRILDLIKLIKKTIHPNYVLCDVLKAGIAFHYGNMPLAIRNEIEDLFKSGEVAFLVCTSTLIEGVNLPAKSIFIRGPKKGPRTPMDEMDFWNLAGRAGRQGKEFQGNVFCLDADDPSVWKNGTPTERKKYTIKSTIDKIIETQQEDLCCYIKNKLSHSTTNSELDYAYTYFLDIYYRYGSVSRSPLAKSYGTELCNNLDLAFDEALQNISIPVEILIKNQGINPIAQQNLLNYFVGFDRSDDDLLPPYPEDDDAQEKYMHIIGRISSCLANDTHKLNSYRSILVTNWMKGYSLSRIIADNIRWNEKNETHKNVPAIIRDTMREIEEYARFRFLKYTNCYIDILKFYLNNKGASETCQSIPQLNLWLEFGASKMTQISLMSMGFTRTAAIEFAELMIDENYDKNKCIWWFSQTDLYSLDLPISILNEAKQILSLQ